MDFMIACIVLLLFFGLCVTLVKVKQNQLPARLARLKTRDPGFDEQEFQGKVAALFLQLKQAWTDRDMDPVRTFMSQDLFSRCTGLLEQQINKGSFIRLEELSLDGVSIIGIMSDANYDHIIALIAYKAKDYTVDAHGEPVSGSSECKTRDEHWTFKRPVKAATGPQEGDFDWLLVGMGKYTPYDHDLVLSNIK